MIRVPEKLRQNCGNCRHRVQAMSGDRVALYSLCHRAPPLMLEDTEQKQLRTWFPIVVETMWCADFRYRGAVRVLIVSSVVTAIAGVVLYAAPFIAWSKIARAIMVP